jgi:hypothetical protein
MVHERSIRSEDEKEEYENIEGNGDRMNVEDPNKADW